ncbi:MAG: methyltetrahydrofolate cobalamin methyltransferase [Clostridiales bacterium]|nr:methyltetrahydrofolate cobalamin methyltransferase [Clostridiales bacterium]
MLIVGELINSSRKAMQEAIAGYDAEFVMAVARAQREKGAAYLDINCGTFVGEETARMEWLVDTVQQAVGLPLCLDSPDPAVLAAALRRVKQPKPMINSISGEEGRFTAVLPLVLEYGAKVIALCMDDGGIPKTAGERLLIAERLLKRLTAAGVPQQDVYFDPLVQPVSTSEEAGTAVLQAITAMRESFPQAHCICGLSNISFGLPNRKLLNRVFLLQTQAAGMDGYILDPTDDRLMGALFAGQALLGRDKYCLGYLSAHRKGLYKENG